MPTPLVRKVASRTGKPVAEVEAHWARAKAQVAKQYGAGLEGSDPDRFYALTTTVFKSMAHARDEDVMSGDVGGFRDAPLGPTPVLPAKVRGPTLTARVLRKRRVARKDEDAGPGLVERHMRMPVGTRRRWGERTFIKTPRGWTTEGDPRHEPDAKAPLTAIEAARALARIANKRALNPEDHRRYSHLRGYLDTL